MIPDVKEERRPASSAVSDSLIRIELITHFHRNPGLESTSEEIAGAIGRDLHRVEAQMIKLVRLHILEQKPHNGQYRYRYLPPHSVAAYLVKRAGK